LRLARGSAVSFRFQGWNSPCEILGVVADSLGRVLRLYFPQLTLAQEQELTNVLYTRPEAWLSWRRLRRVDSPLRSLVEILWLGLRGIFIVLTTFLTARPKSVSSQGSAKRRKREAVIAASILVGGALVVLPPHVLTETVPDTMNSIPQPAFHEE